MNLEGSVGWVLLEADLNPAGLGLRELIAHLSDQLPQVLAFFALCAEPAGDLAARNHHYVVIAEGIGCCYGERRRVARQPLRRRYFCCLPHRVEGTGPAASRAGLVPCRSE